MPAAICDHLLVDEICDAEVVLVAPRGREGGKELPQSIKMPLLVGVSKGPEVALDARHVVIVCVQGQHPGRLDRVCDIVGEELVAERGQLRHRGSGAPNMAGDAVLSSLVKEGDAALANSARRERDRVLSDWLHQDRIL